MRRYWLKIILGALAVFAVGMGAIAVWRAVTGKVRTVARAADPIEIPLPLVPFRVDGERLGTIDRIVIRRKAPRDVDGIDAAVVLRDSAAVARLAGCALLAELSPAGAPSGFEFHDASFRCVPADSALDAEAVGVVTVKPGGEQVRLLLPAAVARRLRTEGIWGHGGPSADSIDAIVAAADSIAGAAGRLADSIAHRADTRR